jgi:hypothetical protein
VGRRALLRALGFDPAALVREAAAFALARAHRGEEGVATALDLAVRREPGDRAPAALRAAIEAAADGR